MKNNYTINHVEYSETILKLIKDDLRICKLLHKLSRTGLDVQYYQTQLQESIFLLIGFRKDQQTDELKDWYFTETEKIYQVKELINLNSEIDLLAEEIYNGLSKRLALFYPSNTNDH